MFAEALSVKYGLETFGLLASIDGLIKRIQILAANFFFYEKVRNTLNF